MVRIGVPWKIDTCIWKFSATSFNACLGKRGCSYGLPCLSFVNACKFVCLLLSLLNLMVRFGIRLYHFISLYFTVCTLDYALAVAFSMYVQICFKVIFQPTSKTFRIKGYGENRINNQEPKYQKKTNSIVTRHLSVTIRTNSAIADSQHKNARWRLFV